MLELSTRRSRFIRDAFLRPVLAVVAIPYTVWGLLAFVRDEIVQPRNAALWKPVFWISKLPWYVWTITTLVVALIVLSEGAYRALRVREMELSVLKEVTEAPDVRLEGTFPGGFALHARGHACEIRTGPIVCEAARIGTHRDGERTGPLGTPRCAIEFPVVSDLRDGSKEVEPALFYHQSPYGRGGWPEKGPTAAMNQFFHEIWVRTRYRVWCSVLGHEDIDFDASKLASAELDVIAAQMQQPVSLAFDITYWDGEHTQMWRRSELFVYEPQTRTAFIRHGDVPMRAIPAETASRVASHARA